MNKNADMIIKIATSCGFMLDNVATVNFPILVKTPPLRLLSALIIYLTLAGCSTAKHLNQAPADPVSRLLASIDSAYAPDKRTTVFNITANGNVLKGETTSAAAKAELLRQLSIMGTPFIDSIMVLPSADLKGITTALANVSVGNIRVQPDHKAELATQATMGTPLQLLKKTTRLVPGTNTRSIHRVDRCRFNTPAE